jgi:hypothetical protein
MVPVVTAAMRPALSRVLRKPVFFERIGAVVELDRRFEAKTGGM